MGVVGPRTGDGRERRTIWHASGMAGSMHANGSTVGTLILLRHGESTWNAENLFTGWVDVGLSEKGDAQARRGGELPLDHDLPADFVHTYLLRRAITTANIALDVCDRHWIEVRRDWRLNKRHFGAQQGKKKKQTAQENVE